tara:strand:+ start:86 stop:205 length:120 start_codon:yes stop_codon:yes gene_type:complete
MPTNKFVIVLTVMRKNLGIIIEEMKGVMEEVTIEMTSLI